MLSQAAAGGRAANHAHAPAIRPPHFFSCQSFQTLPSCGQTVRGHWSPFQKEVPLFQMCNCSTDTWKKLPKLSIIDMEKIFTNQHIITVKDIAQM